MTTIINVLMITFVTSVAVYVGGFLLAFARDWNIRSSVFIVSAALAVISLGSLLSISKGYVEEDHKKFEKASFEAEIVTITPVGHRGGTTLVVITTKGSFEFGLGQINMKGKTRLVKEAGSTAYEIR